jgi:acyl carrier protein
MDDSEIRETIIAALRGIAPEAMADEVTADQPLRDQVDLDSIDFLNFLIRLHEKLGVDVPEADYGKLVTLNDFVAYLRARLP